ncbi:MAG: nuclear transport factor 2 family protein [Kangiellaceae bacterium]|nr:nuclear transport factor 2 family protein [Kangiellaceae bacterium]
MNFKYQWLILFTLLFNLQACAQMPANSSLQVSDEQQLRHLKTVLWSQAYRTNDTELLDRILHDSFQFVQNDGSLSNKRKEIEFLQTSEWKPRSFRYEIQRLEIYHERFAVVSGIGHVIASDGTPYHYTSSNHLIKEDGRWQAISSHVSGYTEQVSQK